MRILVVGAGLSGSVIARELAEDGHAVEVIDQRDHVAGNAYDYVNRHGIRVHKYGPHLFHTSNEEVWNYLSHFTNWLPYKHKVKALLDDGRYVTLPVNKYTKEAVGEENVLDVFFRPYTKKMWGVSLDELNPNIINRVPIRDDDNEYYFPDDKYQAIPTEGYTAMVQNMLNHENIAVYLNEKFDKSEEVDYDHIFNSMPIDVYYDCMYGELPYRSIKFHNFDIFMHKCLPTATVNFTHDGPYTRVTEWKNIVGHGENPYITSMTFEEPCDYKDNNYERYYPVKDMAGKNKDLYQAYKEIKNERTTFIGRCGLYAYLDMHQAVNSALSIVRNFRSCQ
jgi:UDP-galactopyranose mutase